MKSFGNHVSHEKDEQLNRAKIEVENKVKKILKLAKGINGNKDGNLKKKSEIIHLIEDLHQHYDSLCSMYDDLRVEVKKNINHRDDGPSSSSSSSQTDSESYYSPVESTPRRSSEGGTETSGASDVEDTTILKDKLTSSSEVKDKTAPTLHSHEFDEKSGRAKELEAEVAHLKAEIEELVSMRSRLESRAFELEDECKEKECQVKALSVEKWELEERLSLHIQVENQELQGRISRLSEGVREAEKKYKASENELIKKAKNLEEELKELKSRSEEEKQELLQTKSKMERKNTELTDKIGDQQRTLLELGDKLRSEYDKAKFLDSKANVGMMERKIDEMAEELRKQFEDKYRILSRRIRVAEQLHVENKEWYRRTKEIHEQEKKEMQESIGKIKDISVVASEMVIGLDAMVLKMEECNANFLNRISKASCELKFAQEWARRKNKALVHVKQDLDGLLNQLDEKEGEILVYREKVWRWENKMREMEKLMKKKEDGMVGLQEEKREAIRQLCVWIDYHRSRCDYYMKMLFDMNAATRRRQHS